MSAAKPAPTSPAQPAPAPADAPPAVDAGEVFSLPPEKKATRARRASARGAKRRQKHPEEPAPTGAAQPGPAAPPAAPPKPKPEDVLKPLRATFAVLDGILVAQMGPQMRCAPAELDMLSEAWAPIVAEYLPLDSPWVGALLVTAMVYGPKAMTHDPRKPPPAVVVHPQPDPAPAAAAAA